MNRPDVDLVTAHYNACWLRSKGRYKRWIDGRLHPVARRLYIVVAATECCLMDGVPTLLEETRFTLNETADAYATFGLERHAEAVRALRALVDDEALSRDPRERSRQVGVLAWDDADTDRLNRLFPMADEDVVWERLAAVIRAHPEAFPPAEGPV